MPFSLSIIHKYIFKDLVQNFIYCTLTFVFLFLIFDFFDRIDNIVAEKPSFFLIVQYFLLKIPMTISLTSPISLLVSTLLTIGLLSKNSEITALRASGFQIISLSVPVFILGIIVTASVFILNEFLTPYSNRRVREIYNIDIKQKDKTGGYSQNNIFWKDKESFYFADIFDSRTDTLLGFSTFQISTEQKVTLRTDAQKVNFVDPLLGWTMHQLSIYKDFSSLTMQAVEFDTMPIPITKSPEEFYNLETDPFSMNFSELRHFIETQARNGLSTVSYYADLYDKLSFPFVNAIIGLSVIPFALLSARSGSMALSTLAALTLGFSYFVIHSISLSLGRAEMLSPFFAAWFANIIFLVFSVILIKGADYAL
jgi:lipopolysaccharide export system permease protein